MWLLCQVTSLFEINKFLLQEKATRCPARIICAAPPPFRPRSRVSAQFRSNRSSLLPVIFRSLSFILHKLLTFCTAAPSDNFPMARAPADFYAMQKMPRMRKYRRKWRRNYEFFLGKLKRVYWFLRWTYRLRYRDGEQKQKNLLNDSDSESQPHAERSTSLDEILVVKSGVKKGRSQ